MSWWFRPISFHSKSYADNGVAGHVSNCKLMFSSETEHQNTKTFTKTMGWFIRRALAAPNSIISIKFGSGAMQARRIKPIFQLSSATAARSTDFAGRSKLARF